MDVHLPYGASSNLDHFYQINSECIGIVLMLTEWKRHENKISFSFEPTIFIIKLKERAQRNFQSLFVSSQNDRKIVNLINLEWSVEFIDKRDNIIYVSEQNHIPP